MTTTHTPAPWHCSALPHIPMLSAYTYERDETGDDRPVALPVTDANAALIASAPELLAVLKQVADYWAGGDVPAEIDAAMLAAIAKATGV